MENYVRILKGYQCEAIEWDVTLLPFRAIKQSFKELLEEKYE